MKFKGVLYWLSRRSILVISLLLFAIGVFITYLPASDYSANDARVAIGIAAISAFLAAISAFANLLQAVEVQRQTELSQRPYVTVDFTGSNKGAIYFTVQNSGNSPALNLQVSFNPAPMDFSGRGLDEVSTFSRPIPILPSGSNIRQLVDSGHKFLADGKPTEYSIRVEYSGTHGSVYDDQYVYNVEWMKQATVPEKTIEDHLEDIAKILGSIAKK